MDRLFREISIKPRGGSYLWIDSYPASIVLNNDFFGTESLGGNTYDEVLNFDSENVFSLSNTISFESLLSLESNNLLGVFDSLILEQNISLNSHNELSINEILEINELIGFNNESQINTSSFITIEQSITISSNSDISSLNNLQINENLAFNTDSIFSDSNNSSLSNQTVFLTDNNIEFSVSKLAELFTQLISIGNINIKNEAAYLNNIELSINNDAVFSLFVEAYNNISLFNNSGIQFDAVSIIESTFGLNSNSTISIQSQYQNFNGLTFLVNANFIVLGERIVVDYSTFEKIKFTNTSSEIQSFSLKSNYINDFKCKSSQIESFNLSSYEIIEFEPLESTQFKKFNLKSLS